MSSLPAIDVGNTNLVSPQSVFVSVFPKNGEPEGKIDCANRPSQLRSIRNAVATSSLSFPTELVPNSVAAGTRPMINIIVEPKTPGLRNAFVKDNKFMRLAAQVEEDGSLSNFKIALKCLTAGLVVVDGLAYREEYEPPLPQGMTLEQGLAWFFKGYQQEYGDKGYDRIGLEDLHITSAYMSARTGYYFLSRPQNHNGVVYLNEACEDLFMPFGPDLATPLYPADQVDAQFEWECKGAYVNGSGFNRAAQDIKSRYGLSSIRSTLKELIGQLHPDSDWKKFSMSLSKAEISRQAVMAHNDFSWMLTSYTDDFQSARIPRDSHDLYKRLLANSYESVATVIADRDVQKYLAQYAGVMNNERAKNNKLTDAKVPEPARLQANRALAL